MLYTKLHLFIVIEKFINHLVNIKRIRDLEEIADTIPFTNHLVNIKLITHFLYIELSFYLQIT